MKNILIAGGSGFLGSELKTHFKQNGHTVFVLTRNPKLKNDLYWCPDNKKIQLKELKKIEIIINLCGANLAQKKWRKKRKKTLINSRVDPTEFLYQNKEKFPALEHYIGVSGVNCFGNTNDQKVYTETDSFGQDFLSSLVKKWEAAHFLFTKEFATTILRLPIVLSKNKGMLKRMEFSFSRGFGSVLGNGNQIMNWISCQDLKRAFTHVIERKTLGTFQLCASNTCNKEFSTALAKSMNKKIFLPNTPVWVLKLILGEMHTLLVNGNYISTEKFMKTNFHYQQMDINDVFTKTYPNKQSNRT